MRRFKNLYGRTGYMLMIGFIIALQGCIHTEAVQNDEELQQQMMASALENNAVLVDDSYRVKTGDEIEILVWEHSNFDTQTTVSSLGTISIPLIGEVNVSGLTQPDLYNLIQHELSQYIRGEINLTINIRSSENLLVSIFGLVRNPNNYPLIEETSLFEVISSAGGTAENANIRNIKIYRKNGNPNFIDVDLTQYLESGNMSSDRLLVYPGDIVYVPQKNNAVREMGDFLRDVVLLFGIFSIAN
jgi:polysaccharide export outer membrane protein